METKIQKLEEKIESLKREINEYSDLYSYYDWRNEMLVSILLRIDKETVRQAIRKYLENETSTQRDKIEEKINEILSLIDALAEEHLLK